MYLEIVSPEKILFKGNVSSVAVPGVNGEFEMLNNHAAVISTLKEGFVKIKGNVTINEENNSPWDIFLYYIYHTSIHLLHKSTSFI